MHKLIPSSISRSSLAALAIAMAVFVYATPAAKADTCIDCHSDPNFAVTKKKLYDYFREWQNSIHAQEDVSCADCHGGDPTAKKKEAAHVVTFKGKKSGVADATNFAHVPETCGSCHEEKYDAYVRSHHYKLMLDKKQVQKGPNCVTCHGSLNAVALNVTSVGETCALCHSKEKDNHPDVPAKAEALLKDFNSIHGYYRYIRIRGEPAEIDGIVRAVRPRIQKLSNDWHTFDLKIIDPQTKELLNDIRAKRNEVRDAQKKKQAPVPAEPKKATPK
jgi:hypothetical protein